MAASPGPTSHARAFSGGYVAAFLALTLAPMLWRIVRTGAASGFDGPWLTLLLTIGTLLAAAAGAGLVLRSARRRLSAWRAVRPRRSLLIGALAGAMSAGLAGSALQVAVFNVIAAVLRRVGLDPIPSGLVSHPGGLALTVTVVVSTLLLAFCCGIAASALVYFPWLAQAPVADRVGTAAHGAHADA